MTRSRFLAWKAFGLAGSVSKIQTCCGSQSNAPVGRCAPDGSLRNKPILCDPAKPIGHLFRFRMGGVIRVETVDIVILMMIVATAALILFGASWHEYD